MARSAERFLQMKYYTHKELLQEPIVRKSLADVAEYLQQVLAERRKLEGEVKREVKTDSLQSSKDVLQSTLSTVLTIH